jgi:hypothetical protein
MKISTKTTLSLDELNLINKVVELIKPTRAEIDLSNDEIKFTCWGGNWPEDLDQDIRSLEKWHHVEVDLFDGVMSPSFKRVTIRGLKNEDIHH